MKTGDLQHELAKRYKENYPPGTKLLLIHMGDDPFPVEAGMRATVEHVDDIGTLHCVFENGRHLGIIPGEDSFRKLTPDELAEETLHASEQSGPLMTL